MAICQPTLPPFPLQDGILFCIVPDHPRYAVTSDGRIWARDGRTEFGRSKKWHSWSERTPWKHCSGHLYCRFDERNFQVHRLVLTLFNRPDGPGEECRHLDGDPANNRLENLQWGTRAENIADKVMHGTGNQGEKHPSAKLTNDQVRMARALNARHPKRGYNGVVTFLARWFGVSNGQMSVVIRGGAYK